jgi:integrative and conjugative element protein (TIGR02256 family)
MIRYSIGTSGQVLILSDRVVEHLRRHRQRRWYHREAGGQLFAQFDGGCIVAEEATGPRRSDRRTRTSYVPDRRAEQAEILERHRRGLHYIGDWHTHPVLMPEPSRPDAASIAESVTKSTHDLNGFVLIVVGQEEPPAGFHVSIHNATSAVTIEPADKPGSNPVEVT